MRAYLTNSFASPAQIQEIPQPIPRKGEARIRIKACALNFADILMQKGTYQDTPELPFVGGLEIAGIVDDLGPETDGPTIGTRVAVFGGQGGLAEFGCFNIDRMVKIPDDMGFDEAAAFQVAYGTSHVALNYRARMQTGETLLVLGAAGGVGLTAIEVGKLMGATVIACARGADKLDIARKAGADHLIDSDTQDIRAEVLALGGADVVYDPVGGDQWKAAFRACKPDARLIPIGFAGGDVPQIPANHVMVKNLTILGVYWGAYLKFKPEVVTDSLRDLFDWYGQGKLRPHISHHFPLDQTAEALATLKARKSTGKVVVTI
jgi:NADPH2:quinone reductase